LKKPIQYEIVLHRGESRILIRFDYNKAWIDRLRKNTDAKWSKSLGCWHIADTVENRKRCKLELERGVTANKTKTENTKPVNYKGQLISSRNAHVLPCLKQELVIRAYSPSTQKTYVNEVSIFLQHIGNRNADTITTSNIKAYLQYCFEKLQLSENTIHSRLNALKFYYEQVLKNEKLFWEIPRPKKPTQLPKVLSETELKKLFDAASNLKHKAILFVAYSAGLRVSEIINLRLQDIDREREQLFIHCSKGKKDRYVRLSPLVLDILEQYYKLSKIKPSNYLFEGIEKGKPYTIRSAQQIFSDCKNKAGIIKSLSFHSLRHSFATHILEKGVDIRFIKEILGHFDIKTTERYLHIRRDVLINIESPIDSLYKIPTIQKYSI
jgi:integrase/recombinase XerD